MNGRNSVNGVNGNRNGKGSSKQHDTCTSSLFCMVYVGCLLARVNNERKGFGICVPAMRAARVI